MGDQEEILRCDKSIGIKEVARSKERKMSKMLNLWKKNVKESNRFKSKRLPNLPNCPYKDKEVFKCSLLNPQDVRSIHQSFYSTMSKTDNLILKYAVITTPKRNRKKLENSSRRGVAIQYKVPRFRAEYDLSKNRIQRVCKAYLNDDTMARGKREDDTRSKKDRSSKNVLMVLRATLVFTRPSHSKNKLNGNVLEINNLLELEEIDELFPVLEEYIVRERPDHFNDWSDPELFQRFRLAKDIAQDILTLIEGDLEHPTNR
ncbi:hypothetical protein ILUMI_16586 [Ignelater luminosus]|uniref:Uncharacterized protein n=1 Tax=Ignelater luminosus TaxID=2038154 RepID=A0A8K0G5U3_IGNLU|nr:hypothetical protein ILUMI_16586 [Ignelater luminosus]